jgi:hypothetical protein
MPEHPIPVEDLVVRVLEIYGPAEVLAMLEGTSRFTSDENPGSDGVFTPDLEWSQKIELSKLITGATVHLKYMQLTGRADGPVVVIGKHVHGSHPADFARWLEAGAPGIFRPELERAIAAQKQHE